MLTITRKEDESIEIGEDVLIRVVWVRGNRVRLAIEAPRSVNIRRTEIPKRLTPADEEGDNTTR